jgi:hypothetical protein
MPCIMRQLAGTFLPSRLKTRTTQILSCEYNSTGRLPTGSLLVNMMYKAVLAIYRKAKPKQYIDPFTVRCIKALLRSPSVTNRSAKIPPFINAQHHLAPNAAEDAFSFLILSRRDIHGDRIEDVGMFHKVCLFNPSVVRVYSVSKFLKVVSIWFLASGGKTTGQ